MCIGLPGKIIEITDKSHRIAWVDVAGEHRTVHLDLLTPEEGVVGTWVLINAGMAVKTMDENEAADIYRLIEELDQHFEGGLDE